MNYVTLRKVNNDHQQWCLKVRVVRFYEVFGNQDPPELERFELLLLDEEGVAMEAVVPRNWIKEVRAKLTEDRVYFIHYVEIIPPVKKNYRAVEHPYIARFSKHTRILELPDLPENFPMYACSIVPFSELRKRKGRKEYLTDVLAFVTKCTKPVQQVTSSGIKSLVNIHLTDGRHTATLALWGPQADHFPTEEVTNAGMNGPVVVLFVGLTVDIFRDNVALQGSLTCRWYLNPALPEAALLQQSFGNVVGHSELLTLQPHQKPANSATVTELSEYKNPFEIFGNRYVVIAKIKELLPNERWYYTACTVCKSSSRLNGTVYNCRNGDCSNTLATPRYCLAFLAVEPQPADNTDEKKIELICFSPQADELVGATIEALIADSLQVQEVIPHQITRLYGNTYEFNVSIPRGALQRTNTGFKIDSFTKISSINEQETSSQTMAVTIDASKTNSQETTTAVLTDKPRDTPVDPTPTATPPKDILDSARAIPKKSLAEEGNKTSMKEHVTHSELEDVDAEDTTFSDSDSTRNKKPRVARKLIMDAANYEE